MDCLGYVLVEVEHAEVGQQLVHVGLDLQAAEEGLLRLLEQVQALR